MKNLILFLTVFLLSASVFAQPDPRRVPPHSRPKTIVVEPSTETTYIPVDATATPCQMTVKDSPVINGVKLGLTPDELGKTFNIKIIPGAPNQLGISSFSILGKKKSSYFLEGVTYIDSALPNGINEINLSFFNNRLYYAVSVFDNAASKKTAGNFALALSDKQHFSRAWFRASYEQAANVDTVYLFCPQELRFTVHLDPAFDLLKLEMLDLKTSVQITQKRNPTNGSKPQ